MKTNPLATIKKRQTLFRSLTGITQDKFDELLKRTTLDFRLPNMDGIEVLQEIRNMGLSTNITEVTQRV